MFKLLGLGLLATVATAAWVGEDYWTTIGYDGEIKEGRSENDFLSIQDPDSGDIRDGWIAYWITRTKYGNVHYEAFGQAFRREDGRICAWFIGQEQEAVEVCGGFRVLSRNRRNPQEQAPFRWIRPSQASQSNSIGYHGHFVNKLQHVGGQVFYGDGQLYNERYGASANFKGVNPSDIEGGLISITSLEEFENRCWFLQKLTPDVPPERTGQWTGQYQQEQRRPQYVPQPGSDRYPYEQLKPQDNAQIGRGVDPRRPAPVPGDNRYPYEQLKPQDEAQIGRGVQPHHAAHGHDGHPDQRVTDEQRHRGHSGQEDRRGVQEGEIAGQRLPYPSDPQFAQDQSIGRGAQPSGGVHNVVTNDGTVYEAVVAPNDPRLRDPRSNRNDPRYDERYDPRSARYDGRYNPYDKLYDPRTDPRYAQLYPDEPRFNPNERPPTQTHADREMRRPHLPARVNGDIKPNPADYSNVEAQQQRDSSQPENPAQGRPAGGNVRVLRPGPVLGTKVVDVDGNVYYKRVENGKEYFYSDPQAGQVAPVNKAHYRNFMQLPPRDQERTQGSNIVDQRYQDPNYQRVRDFQREQAEQQRQAQHQQPAIGAGAEPHRDSNIVDQRYQDPNYQRVRDFQREQADQQRQAQHQQPSIGQGAEPRQGEIGQGVQPGQDQDQGQIGEGVEPAPYQGAEIDIPSNDQRGSSGIGHGAQPHAHAGSHGIGHGAAPQTESSGIGGGVQPHTGGIGSGTAPISPQRRPNEPQIGDGVIPHRLPVDDDEDMEDDYVNAERPPPPRPAEAVEDPEDDDDDVPAGF